jgi:hypothetical protein
MQQQRGPMDKKAFEREVKQRMAFQLYTLQEFWRNLGLKNIPPGTLNGIISQTKAELNADWLSVTPQSLRDMVVRHRRLKNLPHLHAVAYYIQHINSLFCF